MKIKLPLFIALLFSAQASFAQFGIGLKVGTNIAKVEGRSFSDEFRYGYLLGAYASIPVGGRFAIQPEVLYTQLPARTGTAFEDIYQTAFNGNTNVTLNYISIPIVLNYKLAPFLSLQAGPQFSILRDRNQNLLQNGRDAFDKGDLSMLGGAQLSLGKIKLSGRYFVGLNNINDIDNQDKWTTQGYQLALGLGF